MDAETAGLIRSLREQLDRMTALVRTLLEMSNLQSVSRTDQIALAPLVEEILTLSLIHILLMTMPLSRLKPVVP